MCTLLTFLSKALYFFSTTLKTQLMYQMGCLFLLLSVWNSTSLITYADVSIFIAKGLEKSGKATISMLVIASFSSLTAFLTSSGSLNLPLFPGIFFKLTHTSLDCNSVSGFATVANSLMNLQ